ncbi:MAG TPA: hypothetical protein VK698_04150 [Kofleriaceae bacterium]|nr:hypothetical protein [Kofleriaceae bacterium]
MTGWIALAAVAGLATVGRLVGAWRARRRWLRVTMLGDGMAPTYRDGELLLARRLPKPRRGSRPRLARRDVVVFRPPSALSFQLESSDLPVRVMRVVATGGDPLPEPAGGASRVPSHKLLVAGDNPDAAGQPDLIDAEDVIALVGESPTDLEG